MGKRDEFSLGTKIKLAMEVALLCSNPSCRKLTRAPSDRNIEQPLNLGEAAHICAAAKGGPRYDASQSQLERRDHKNGVWLCLDCSGKVDTDWRSYSRGEFYEWKADAQAYAAANLGKHPSDWLGAPPKPEVALRWHDGSGRFVLELQSESTPPIRPLTRFSETDLETAPLEMRTAGNEYNTKVEEHDQLVAKYRKDLAQFNSMNRMDFIIENSGTAFLEEAEVKLTFPDGFVVLDRRVTLYDPALPSEPFRPVLKPGAASYLYNALVPFAGVLKDPNALIAGPIKRPGTVRRPIATEWIAQGNCAHIGLQRVRHGATTALPALYFSFPRERAGETRVEFEIHARNLPKCVVGTLVLLCCE